MDISALLAWPDHPVAFKVFNTEIYWYAIIIVLGMIAAFVIISLLFKRRNMSADLFTTYFIVALPVAIVTTRLFYCITDGMPITEWFSFKSIREGGLSIVGGIIGGAASVIIVSLVKKVNFFRVGDCIVVGLMFAQAVGRWGNFVNQEVYGGIVTNEALQFFPFAVYINADASWHYAFFFYESMVMLIGAVLLFVNGWLNPKKPNGLNTGIYFTIYGLTRTIMEPLRDPQYILGNKVPWSMVMSIVMLVAGLGLIFYVLFMNKKKEGALFGSKTGDPYGITKYIGDKKDEVAYFSKMNMMCAIYPENYVEKVDEDEEEEGEVSEEEIIAELEKNAEKEEKPARKVEWREVKTSDEDEKETEKSEENTEAKK
ncbi:MAG: prolipoprotein diacylglyceryl transferase [Clostridia bacterium]|nr:prolipoprotein diacylglyceryl transferase [Clostridia bacterium]